MIWTLTPVSGHALSSDPKSMIVARLGWLSAGASARLMISGSSIRQTVPPSLLRGAAARYPPRLRLGGLPRTTPGAPFRALRLLRLVRRAGGVQDQCSRRTADFRRGTGQN